MYFTTDTIAGSVAPTRTASEQTSTLDFETASKTRITNDPWTDAFDTEQFYTFDVVAARPIEQQYTLHGEQYTFKKPAKELRATAWSVDNVPYPIRHPTSGPVSDTSDVHGFVRNPRYVEGYDEHGDALVGDLYVPVDDDELKEFLSNHRGVSIGFFNDLDWSVDEDGVDAYQTNILVDHVAGVENGRCSIEDGCGVMTDASHMEERSDTEHERYEDRNRHRHRYESKERAMEAAQQIGCEDVHTHNIDGQTIYMPCSSMMVFEQMMSDATDEIEDIPTPCSDGPCTCGLHTPTYDAPQGIHVDDEGNWFGVAPDENPDDTPKYELNTCNDVKDAFNLRNNGDYDIDTSTLVARIKRAASSHDCSDEQRPWTDDESNEHMTDDNDNSDIDFDSIVAGMSLDALVESNERVEQLRADKNDAESRIEVLEDKVESLENERDSLEADLEDYRAAEKDNLIATITDLTSAWDADSLRDEDVDELERRKEIAKDAATSPSTGGNSGGKGGDGDGDEPTVDSPDEGGDSDGFTVAMEHRTWS